VAKDQRATGVALHSIASLANFFGFSGRANSILRNYSIPIVHSTIFSASSVSLWRDLYAKIIYMSEWLLGDPPSKKEEVRK
jgi:hypothetical protein